MGTLAIIDGLITAISGLLNLFGASQKVSEIIGKRIAEGGRAWTDEEKATVQAELDAAQAYAGKQLGLLDPPA